MSLDATDQPAAPRLSIITPTFNRLMLLGRCLDALSAQSERDFEVIVAVDGSTDGTLAFLTAFARSGRLELRALPLARGGQASARNAAIGAARGSILVFVDDDLLLDPETLARHRAFHEVFERSVAIGLVRYGRGPRFAPLAPTWVDFTGMNTSLGRDLALEAGLFDANLSSYGGEDIDFALRLQRLGARFRPLRDAGATHLGERVRDPDKGRSAGRQAVQVAARYGSGVAWRLGVHPTLLAVKRALYNPVTAAIAGRSRAFAWERAYQSGALEAQAEQEASLAPAAVEDTPSPPGVEAPGAAQPETPLLTPPADGRGEEG